ncbi:MAG: HEPN domain-containing protein [Kiritimatiellae bacterium]|nr:HEPN domain-containing protein [Kiritimatiellia bacterium]
MNDEYARLWILKAKSDLKIAEDELKTKNPATDAVCFHCQQAAEKAFKAFLSFHGVAFEKVHDLEYLSNLCLQKDGSFAKLDIGDLSSYAVTIRYPDDFYFPSVEEAVGALKTAQLINAFVAGKIGI